MHLLQAQDSSPLDADEAIDLGQSPGDVVVLSAADTELSALALASQSLDDDGMRLRIANLGMLKHPYSVDLYVEAVLADAKLVVVRALGGQSYWQYLIEQVVLAAQENGTAVVLLPGDDKPDPELAALSTVSPVLYDHLWQCLNQGGPENTLAFWQSAIAQAPVGAIQPMPEQGIWEINTGTANPDHGPTVWVLFYRALLMSGDTAPIFDLVTSLRRQGVRAQPFFMASLKSREGRTGFEQAVSEQGDPAVIVTTTAFTVSASAEMDEGGYFARFDVPVIQAVLGSSTEQQWREGTAGLAARDIVMNAALPELDGRVLSRAISFKSPAQRIDRVEWDVVRHQSVPDRVNFVAETIKNLSQLKTIAANDKSVALVLANYPNKDGRMANGVGLDTPASTLQLWQALAEAGYQTGSMPVDGDALMAFLSQGTTNQEQRQTGLRLSIEHYQAAFQALPESIQQQITTRWGTVDEDPFYNVDEHALCLPLHQFGNLLVGVQPARGYNIDPETSYHDPDLPPPHGYLAFYFLVRQHAHAVVHVGKHGNLEWLPGKGIALSQDCFPDAILGTLPHFYPFIVNDPGEGTQAKRRAQAVIIDHLTPPLTRAEGYGALAELERQVDEYFQASGLDPRRLTLLKKGILDDVRALGLDQDAGIKDDDSEQDALAKLDNHLCALKELQIRDGLHVLGLAPQGDQRRDLLSALVRLPRGDGQGPNASLQQSIAKAFALSIDPLDCDYAQPWDGPQPTALQQMDTAPWRTAGDTVERIELFSLALLVGETQAPNEAVQQVVDEANHRLDGLLAQSADNEITNLVRGLSGAFVSAGSSGAPTRGRLDIFPTGRNFYSVDSRALPTPAAWTLGKKSAERLVQRYRQDHGKWPSAMLLSMWGTANMRTGGDDIAQALALLGVQPTWDAKGSGRVTGVELLPLSLLGRPRVDLTMRISGFFRDAFPAQIELLDKAVKMAAAAKDEPEKQNPIAARVHAEVSKGVDEAVATRRIFGSMPGAYGAGLQALIDEKGWTAQEDLAKAYVSWSNFAYGGGAEGTADLGGFEQRLAQTEAVIHNQDNQEHDILDSDDYYQFEGGAAAAVKMARGGEAVSVYHNDHSRPENPVTRSLREEMGRIVRGRAANPKWIAGAMRHGYKGAFEIAATVDYLFAFSATTDAVANQHYDALYSAYVEDESVRNFMENSNPAAQREMAERFLEAIDRGLWQPTRNAAYDSLKEILGD